MNTPYFLTPNPRKRSLFFLLAVIVLAVGILEIERLATLQKQISTPFYPSQKQPMFITPEQPVTLLFVGDIMLSREIGNIMQKENDWTYPFQKIADETKKADLAFGNLEGPLSSRGTNIGSIYSFRASPRSVDGLLYSGFDILSVANNHMWDYGHEAFEDTLKILDDNNISYTGGGRSYEEAHTPIIKEVRGTKIAYLGYTKLLPSFLGTTTSQPAVAFPNEQEVIGDIQKAKTMADIIVVSFHFGDEYQTTHNSFQENLARIAINAGANLVIGHHPHVAQEVVKYREGYIAYSLGNFVFDQNFSKDTNSGLILRAEIIDKHLANISTEKVIFNKTYQPEPETK